MAALPTSSPAKIPLDASKAPEAENDQVLEAEKPKKTKIRSPSKSKPKDDLSPDALTALNSTIPLETRMLLIRLN